MESAEEFEQWMKEEDKRIKGFKFDSKPIVPEDKLLTVRKYEKKVKQLNLF